jgi:hypothetical protein
MTFQIFVGYGDIVAKQIAENLGYYLRRCGMITFVASTDPMWMLPGYNVNQILKQLRVSDILVATCTRNTPPTSKLGREVSIAKANHMPIFPFLERNINPPFGLGNFWKIEFDLSNPWTQHRKVALNILWLIEKSKETQAQLIT